MNLLNNITAASAQTTDRHSELSSAKTALQSSNTCYRVDWFLLRKIQLGQMLSQVRYTLSSSPAGWTTSGRFSPQQGLQLMEIIINSGKGHISSKRLETWSQCSRCGDGFDT